MGGSNSTEIGGVRVFKVTPGSPAAEAGLEVFFDFILEINGVKMDPSGQQSFAKVIQDAENGAAKLQVFNTRANTTREVIVNPRKWAGTGLLGATVRYDVVDPAENHGIRVLEVFPNSPAAHAGLVPFQDFLLGTAQSVFHDIDELVEVVNQAINQRIQVYVYNADTESVREVSMAPNNDWGGEGFIGCDIGTGLLHRIPAPRRLPGGLPMAAPMTAPGIAGQQWQPPAGIPPPTYPPGAQVPAAVPPVVPQAVPPPAMPAVPGIPQVPVPAVPTVPAGLPGIAPSGVWPPQAQPGVPAPAGVPMPAPVGVPAPGPALVALPVPVGIPAPAPFGVPAPVGVPVPAPAVTGYAPAGVPAPQVPLPVPTVPGVVPVPVAGVPQVPAPAPVPVPVPVPTLVAVPTPAPAPVSQSEELAALQARIAQLGAAAVPPPVPAPAAVAGVKWPPQPAAGAPAAGLPQLPLPQQTEVVPGSPLPVASPTSPETPAAGMAGRQAPPCTPMHADDAPAPTDLSQAMDPAAFAGGPSAAPLDASPVGAAALL